MDDLGRRLESELERERMGDRPDVRSVLSRGKRLRLYRQGGIVASAIALLVVSGLAFASVTRPDSGGLPVAGPTSAAATATSEPVIEDIPEKDQAEIFAFRAVAATGLMNPVGSRTYLFSRSAYTERTSDGWQVGFVSQDCAPREMGNGQTFSCTWDVEVDENGNPLPDTFVQVVLQDRSWNVIAIRGPMLDHEQKELMRYQMEQQPEPSHWEYPSVALVEGPEQPQVMALPLWVGPIPSGAPPTDCVARAWDTNDEVVFESRFTEEAPGENYSRMATVRGQEIGDSGGRAVRGSVDCVQSGQGDPAQAVDDRRPEMEEPQLPDGPRYSVASGVFDDSWGSDSGEEWRLMVWGDHVMHCWRFEVGEVSEEDREGVSCTTDGDGPYSDTQEMGPFGGWSYIPAGVGYERAIAYGVVSLEVRQLAFRYGDTGGVIFEKTLDAPHETTIQRRFFIAFLLPDQCGTVTALDKNENELATKPLMRPACDPDVAITPK